MNYRKMVVVARAFLRHIQQTQPVSHPWVDRFAEALSQSNWEWIRTNSPNPADFQDAHSYRVSAQLSGFLRKAEDLPSSVDKEGVAYADFFESERRNYQTNLFWKPLTVNDDLIPDNPIERWAQDRIILMRRYSQRVLGSLPDHLDGRFGPGSVAEASAWDDVSLLHKLCFTSSKTRNFSPELHAHFFGDTALGRLRTLMGTSTPTPGYSVALTVPKDGTTDRFIAKECGDNVYAQLGVGSHFKARIQSVAKIRMLPGYGRSCSPYGNVYLTGQELHQRLARDGSRDGHWVTLDMKSASNRNALVPTRYVLGPVWAPVCDELRSTHLLVRKKYLTPGGDDTVVPYHLQMYSAMGNGFTFEVLTLIMLAAAYASGFVPGVDAFAYGDDVVLANDYRVDAFVKLVTLLGHTVNTKKSFVDGPFRESCGGDYWEGEDVRPVIVDEIPKTATALMAFHNGLRQKWPGFTWVSSGVPAWVPKHLRVWGLEGDSPSTFWTDKAELLTPYRGKVEVGPPLHRGSAQKARRHRTDARDYETWVQAPVRAHVEVKPQRYPLFPCLWSMVREPEHIAHPRGYVTHMALLLALQQLPEDGAPLRASPTFRDERLGWYVATRE